jgi:hypothetical protein
MIARQPGCEIATQVMILTLLNSSVRVTRGQTLEVAPSVAGFARLRLISAPLGPLRLAVAHH